MWPFDKKDDSELFGGVGVTRLSQRRSKLLQRVLFVSLLFHVGGAAVFGSYMIAKHVLPEAAPVFVTPPPTKTYDPHDLLLKVKTSQQQRSSSRPSLIPRMVTTHLSPIAMPEIKVDPKLVTTTVQPKFRPVSGQGMGAALGNGFGEAGFGDGVSTLDFIGIPVRGAAIAILVDVSVSMVEDVRGGPQGFRRTQERLNKLVDALGESTLFNVVVFADAASTFETKMLPATDSNKTRAKQFLKTFNNAGNYGLTSGNYSAPAQLGLPAAGGTTRLDLALDAAFEQGADTILIISDGLPRVGKALTADVAKAHSAMVEKWYADNAQRLQRWAAENAQGESTGQKVWIPATPARPPKTSGLKEGQAPDKGSPAIPGHWEVVRSGHQPRPQPPTLEPGWWTFTDFAEHLRLLHTDLYVKRGKRLPVIHAIGYAIDKDGGDFLKALAGHYKGHYQLVARID
jgi:hypothetical protein